MSPWILSGILVAFIAALVWMYNSLVGLRIRADNAWSDIDVQLKRRHDLIPNIVEAVRGYASHERGVYESVAKLRSAAIQATAPPEKAALEERLTGAVKSLFAIAESYPELKASEQFRRLQEGLTDAEDTIQNARRYYNAVVRDLNIKIHSFPSNLVAGAFGFRDREFFLAEAGEREAVAVKV